MTNTVLIAGASGLVGSAAAIEFADAGWNVIAVSRRVPELLEDRRYRHLALDLTDAQACRRAAAELDEVTHVVYSAVFELPGLIAGWTDPVQIETNGRMLVESAGSPARTPPPEARLHPAGHQGVRGTHPAHANPGA